MTLHPRGLTLRGARLTGQLNWRQLPLRTAVALRDCLLDTETPAVFDRATGIQLELIGCRLAGLSARQLHLTHNLVLDGSVVLGQVAVAGAEIGGSLTADGASFGVPAEDNAARPGMLAVDGDELHVGAHLRLSAEFRAHGQVALTGARINGRLVCTDATLTSDTDALMAERLQVGGEVMLDGCNATGDVRLSGAKIGRQLNCLGGSFTNPGGNALSCDGADITGDVLFTEGFAAVGNVVLIGAKIGGQLNCLGGSFTNLGGNALSCDSADITGAVFLGERFTAAGAVVLTGAKIGGQLNCLGGKFTNPGGNALSCDTADIVGAVFLSERFAAAGAVVLTGAKIGGQLSCSGGKFTNPSGNALTCDYADIGSTVFLRNRFTAFGRVRLRGAKIGGDLNCSGGEFINSGENALSCNGAQITGEVLLTKTLLASGEAMFSATGEVILSGAKIAGRLDCSGGKFANPGKKSLTCDGADIAGDVLFTEGFAATGEVVLIGAKIGAQLNCSGGKFFNDSGNALSCDSADITGAVFLSERFTAVGAVVLTGAKIGGQLSCSGGKFFNPGGNALTCDHTEIKNAVFLRNGFIASGEVRMPGAKIGGQFNCSGAEFINSGRNALSCNGAEITGDVLLAKTSGTSGEVTFNAVGEVILSGAKIGGRLDCSGGKFTNPSGNAFDGTTMTVQNSFIWAGLAPAPRGIVDLTNAHVGQLKDDQASWPAEGELRIAGFSYDRLSDEAENDPQVRLTWIHLQRGYSPQPYRQLADVYRNAGKESYARTILIAKQRDLRTRGKLPWYSSIWNAFIGATIGHGYRTLRVALLLPVLYVISVLLIGYAGRHSDMLAVHATPGHHVSSATCTSRYPCLSTLAYPIDYVVPILNLHQAEYWQPDAHTFWGHVARDWLFLATALGWVATTLLVAAITGLARND